MVDIISTTKDNLDDATNAPDTASDVEEEDNKVVVEHKYIIRAKDDTIDNNEVRDEVVDKKRFKHSVGLRCFPNLELRRNGLFLG